MIEYIVHADDFGYSESVNSCINECIQKGWVSETSLMVNMPGCESAVELANRYGYAHRVGIHLNLTEGVPLTDEIKGFSRFCTNGKFNKKFHLSLASRLVLSKAESKAAFNEIDAQMRKFLSYGRMMMRIDSHHHSHTDWSIYRLLGPLAMKYGFGAMRITANCHRVRLDVEIYKKILNSNIRKNFKTRDYFDGIVPGILDKDVGRVEVMVHPLIWEGVLCDSRKPFAENIARVQAVKNSCIRRAV